MRLLDGCRKLSRRKQSLIAAGALVLAFTGISGSEAQPTLADTVHTFTPPAQFRPKPQSQSKPKPKPRDSLQQARYLYFDDPRSTAKFMAEYLNGGSAFDDVFYGFATPFEITLHGNLNGSRFDLRLYKVGRQKFLMKNCMMGSCYQDWAGALMGHESAQGRARFLLRQRVRAGVLRLGKRFGD